MALTHPIFVPLYAATGTPLSILKVAGTGFTIIESNELAYGIALTHNQVRNVITWEGNVYFPVGYPGINQGWVEFNPRINKFHFAGFIDTQSQMMPIGNYIGRISSTAYQRGPSMRYFDTVGGVVWNSNKSDWARLGDTVHIIYGVANFGTYVWSYPFTGVPAYAANPHALFCQRLCAYKGKMYGINVSTGTSYLYEYAGAAWSRIGVGFVLPEAGDVQVAWSNYVSFFEAAGKLWLIVSYNTPGTATQWHRIFEVDEVAGTVTEQNALVPAGWKVVPNNTTRGIFEVIDDTKTSRLVYLFGNNGSTTTGGWDCYEFDGTNPMTLITTGGNILGLHAGAIWDENAQGCQVVSGIDSIPSSYATIEHKVSDIHNNPVDIDLRYQDLSNTTIFPVFPQCTEKLGVGSEGKTSLISKPASPTIISELSDNFDDAVIDPILWEIVNLAHREDSRDYGSPYSAASSRPWYNIVEQGGSIRFGGTNPVPSIVTNAGIGLKSRWGINGAFAITGILSNLADLTTNANRHLKMILMVKTATNDGFGIYIWKNVNVYGRGFYLKPNMVPVVSSIGATLLADGMDIQIGRDAFGNISCHLDIAGPGMPEDITPATPPLYNGEVQIWTGAFNENGGNWTASVIGPGFSDLLVAGAGTLGLYEGSVQHDFMWDHITDLGANNNVGVVIHVDTN